MSSNGIPSVAHELLHLRTVCATYKTVLTRTLPAIETLENESLLTIVHFSIEDAEFLDAALTELIDKK
jgi:hypothetical protein